MDKITTYNHALTKPIKKTIDTIIVQNLYPGPQAVYDIVKKEYSNVTLQDIRNYLMTKIEYQLTWERKQTTQSMGHIVSYIPFAICQIDIFDLSKYSFDYSQYKSKKKVDGLTTNFNKGYKYIFCLIDVFSRFVDCIPMKTKSIEDTTHALELILDTYKLEPIDIMSDSDSSFLGGKFQNFLKKRDIELDPVVVNDHRALGIIDRFARTLKTRLTKLFLANSNTNWIDHIADVIFSYNNTRNRGILNYTPQQVVLHPEAQQAILKLNLQKAEKNRMLNKSKNIIPGDHVRLYIENKFRKGTEPNYTTQLYEVKSKNGKRLTLTNGKEILDQNVLKITGNQYIDRNLLTNSDENIANSNIIDETNKEKRITQKLKHVGIERPTYEQLNEPRVKRNITKHDYSKLNKGQY